MKKTKKIIGISILLLITIIISYVVIIIIPNKDDYFDIKEVDKVNNYVQYSRDSNLYKDNFKQLKKTLTSDTIDYEKYAEYISKLFIIDLYSLNNKNSKEDVGGVQYLKEELKENFILNASNTLYKYINSMEEKPIVKDIEIESITKTSYTIEKIEYEAYEVKLKWEYEKDLDYENACNLIVIKDNNNLYIVEKE